MDTRWGPRPHRDVDKLSSILGASLFPVTRFFLLRLLTFAVARGLLGQLDAAPRLSGMPDRSERRQIQ